MAQEEFEQSRVVKKRTNWWRPLALVLLVYAIYSWNTDPFALEYYGYCKADGKTRDPEMLMNMYIKRIIGEQAEGGANSVQYGSVLDFYEKNPGCCRMYAWDSTQAEPLAMQKMSKLILRTFFWGEYYPIRVSYRALVVGEWPYTYHTTAINACGTVSETFSRTEKSYAPEGAAYFNFITGHPR